MKGDLLGVIECPHCGDSMKVKEDKNGDPFGHCEHCSGQVRVGGSAGRVARFLAKNPHLKKPGEPEAVKVQEVEKPAAPKKPAKPKFDFFGELSKGAAHGQRA